MNLRFFFFLFLSGPLFLMATPGQASVQIKTVTVGSVGELVQSLKSDTEIRLLPGRYNLSEVAGQISTPQTSWEDVFDGQELVLRNIQNLSITGKPGSEIVVDPRYAWVFRFENCKDITLKNLTMGHTIKGSCVGGVVSFSSGKNIRIENSVLYGSGTEGVSLDEVNDFVFINSVIKECTYDLMTIKNSKKVSFTNSAFLNTGEFDMVLVQGDGDVAFNGCTFRDCLNDGYYPFFFSFDDKGSAKVKLQYCQFIDNRVDKFTNKEGRITLIDNVFRGNQFAIPK